MTKFGIAMFNCESATCHRYTESKWWKFDCLNFNISLVLFLNGPAYNTIVETPKRPTSDLQQIRLTMGTGLKKVEVSKKRTCYGQEGNSRFSWAVDRPYFNTKSTHQGSRQSSSITAVVTLWGPTNHQILLQAPMV